MEIADLIKLITAMNQPQAPAPAAPANQLEGFAGLLKQLNAGSELEQQHSAWVGAQSPSYMGNANNPFNSGFFGAKPGTPEFSGRTTPLDMSAAAKAPARGNQYEALVAGARAASPQSFMPSAPVIRPPGNPDALDSNMAEQDWQYLLANPKARPARMLKPKA